MEAENYDVEKIEELYTEAKNEIIKTINQFQETEASNPVVFFESIRGVRQNFAVIDTIIKNLLVSSVCRN